MLKVISGGSEVIWKIKGNSIYKDSRVGWLFISCIVNYKGIIRN